MLVQFSAYQHVQKRVLYFLFFMQGNSIDAVDLDSHCGASANILISLLLIVCEKSLSFGWKFVVYN